MKKLINIPNLDIIFLCLSLAGVVFKRVHFLGLAPNVYVLMSLVAYLSLVVLCFLKTNAIVLKMVAVVYFGLALLPDYGDVFRLWGSLFGPIVFFSYVFYANLKKEKSVLDTVLSISPIAILLIEIFFLYVYSFEDGSLYVSVALVANYGLIMFYETEVLKPYNNFITLMFNSVAVGLLFQLGFH